MKRISIFSILSIIAIFLACCQTKNDVRQKLQNEIDETNKQLPLKISFISIDKLEIRDNDYMVFIEIDETKESLEGYTGTLNQFKFEVINIAFGKNEKFKEAFLASGLNLRICVSGSISNNTRQISYTATEMKELTSTSYSTKDLLNDFLVEARKTIPGDLGNGLTGTGIDIVNNYLIYTIETDESFVPIQSLKSGSSEERVNTMVESFNESETPAELLFIKLLKMTGVGLKYIYKSSITEDTVAIVVTPEVINSRIQEKDVQ